MPTPETPPAEFEVDAPLVRALLREQHPGLADRELGATYEGWDNRMFRLGDDLAVRLPRRQAAVALMRREQQWLPVIARWFGLPVPVPVRLGRPSEGYPCPWTVVRWLPGAPVGGTQLSADALQPLVDALARLHAAPADGAPFNAFRSVPLRDRDAKVRERTPLVLALEPALLRRWEHLCESPPSPRLGWVHGDLHPYNVLTEGGAITGVIDWGDAAAGDPAIDFSCLWFLAGAEERDAALERVASADDGALLARAEGWALFFALMFQDWHTMESGRIVPDPTMRSTCRRVLEEIASRGAQGRFEA